MRDAYLVTYLNDHLGLSVAEIELARRCLSSNRESELGKFLEELLLALEEDQVRIRKLLKRLNASESTVKKLGGWMMEKAGRLKLNNSLFRYSDLSRLIELETMAAGLQAKAAMWSVLGNYRSGDPRFDGIDFSQARSQSEQMLEGVMNHHARAAEQAIGNGK